MKEFKVKQELKSIHELLIQGSILSKNDDGDYIIVNETQSALIPKGSSIAQTLDIFLTTNVSSFYFEPLDGQKEEQQQIKIDVPIFYNFDYEKPQVGHLKLSLSPDQYNLLKDFHINFAYERQGDIELVKAASLVSNMNFIGYKKNKVQEELFVYCSNCGGKKFSGEFYTQQMQSGQLCFTCIECFKEERGLDDFEEEE